MILAALQLNSSPLWARNREQIAESLALLPPERPCLVLLPENFACFGGRDDYHRLAEPLGHGPIQRQLSAWAREHGIWLVAGSLPTRVAGQTKVHTSSLVYDDQGVLRGHYHKLHLFDVDVADAHGSYRESDSFLPGRDYCVVPSPFGGLGLSICYDVRFPELYRKLRSAGADVLLVPAAFTRVTGQAHWRPLLQARAIENQCYLVAANQWGRHGPERETWGRSLILDPWGDLLAERPEGTGLLHARLDAQRLSHIRNQMPVLAHARMTPDWKKDE